MYAYHLLYLILICCFVNSIFSSLLSDKSRKHKTSICRRTCNPVWNQTLTFEDAVDEGLELTLWNHDLLSNNDLLGTVRLEYDSPLWGAMLSRNSFWVEGILRLT